MVNDAAQLDWGLLFVESANIRQTTHFLRAPGTRYSPSLVCKMDDDLGAILICRRPTKDVAGNYVCPEQSATTNSEKEIDGKPHNFDSVDYTDALVKGKVKTRVEAMLRQSINSILLLEYKRHVLPSVHVA